MYVTEDEEQDEPPHQQGTLQDYSYSLKIINRQQPGVGFMIETFKTVPRKR